MYRISFFGGSPTMKTLTNSIIVPGKGNPKQDTCLMNIQEFFHSSVSICVCIIRCFSIIHALVNQNNKLIVKRVYMSVK